MQQATAGGQQPHPKATRREWLGLAVIALPCIVYAMDFTVLHLAVPSLTADLDPTAAQMLWIVDIYGFLLAGFLVPMGSLGDRIGRRRLLMFGGAGFAAASIFAALSTSAPMLIAARALLGLAGATLAPSTLSLIRNMFHDPHERMRAISIWGTSFATGGAIGPLVGGVLLGSFWWGSVFLVAVPVMALLLVAGPRLLPEYRDPSPGPLDLGSAALAVAAVLSAIYGLKHAAQAGLGWQPALFLAVGFTVGAVFIRRQRRLEHPLVDLRLFRTPMLVAMLAMFTLVLFALFAMMFHVAQYLQLVLGLSPLAAGLATLPMSLTALAGSLAAPNLARRFDADRLLVASLLAAAAGFLVCTLVGVAGLPALVLGSVVFTLGMGPVGILATDRIVGAAPPERAGSAASLSETSAEFGGALGLAVLGALGVAVYRTAMAGKVPDAITEPSRAAAGSSFAGAVEAAAQAPAAVGAPLLDAAHDAYALAFVTVALVSAAIVLATAWMVRRAAARARRPMREEAQAPSTP